MPEDRPTLEARVEGLAADVRHVQSDVTEIKTDIRELRTTIKEMDRRLSDKIDRKFAALVGSMIALGTALAGGMATGFLWLAEKIGG
jgi:hypothetical protein